MEGCDELAAISRIFVKKATFRAFLGSPTVRERDD
jgi:F0F1-type ATP synthase delta subunit